MVIRPRKKKKKKNPDLQAEGPAKVGRVFFFFFFFLAAKDPKTQKFWTFFAEQFWENILTCFQKFSAKIFRFWSKSG